ncbi:hypothetical protein KJ575_00905 [Patescibacteria group bacterium]|nr:hypothetical protein [Patescibacteria group bacterium]MBU4368266.1 hypothetical protein [Patescibacteria group bacterium]
MRQKSNLKLETQIQNCLSYHDTSAAYVLAEDLRRLLREDEKENDLTEEEKISYKNFLVRLQLQSLPLFSEEEIAEFFRKNFLKMVNDPDINLYDRFKAKQIAMPYEFAEDFLLQIIEAIHRNEETIGKERIFISGNPEPQVPTVANWLLDYDRNFGTEPQKDLTWLEYVNSGANASRLNAKDKKVLRKLLKFYEYLKPEYIE